MKIIQRITQFTVITTTIASISACQLASDSKNKHTNHTELHDKNNPVPTLQNGNWIYGDMHVHSTGSDGHYTLPTVLDQAFNHYGAHFIVSTDHSGFNAYQINSDLVRTSLSGDLILNTDRLGELHSHDFAKIHYPNDKGPVNKEDVITPIENSITQYRNQLASSQQLLLGMEWTIPYINEHATLLMLDPSPASTLANFHNQFAKGNDTPKTFSHTQSALEMLESTFANKAIVALNHPSRKNKVKIEDIRRLHNAAPTALIGMEGAPGHQRNPLARGSYEQVDPIILDEYSEYGIAYHGRTYGGFDYMTAKVGGVWDALLSEGRHFSIIAQSDFHSTSKDFWPNQYSKTHLFLSDNENQSAAERLVHALQSGTSFVTHGDLISHLNFSASSPTEEAFMGQTLAVEKGDNITIHIQATMPVENHIGHTPELAFIDVIAGKVSAPLSEQHPHFNKPFTDTTSVIKSYTAANAEWPISKNEHGRTVTFSFTLSNVQDDQYIRLRGSNHKKGSPGFVDEFGNPIVDTEKLTPPTTDIEHQDLTPAEIIAWQDLWFYSNPIYIQVR